MLILASALASDDPLIKWGPMIMCFTGTIISEFVYARTSEIKQIDGVWVWHLGENRVLKTGNRPRVIQDFHGRVVDHRLARAARVVGHQRVHRVG